MGCQERRPNRARVRAPAATVQNPGMAERPSGVPGSLPQAGAWPGSAAVGASATAPAKVLGIASASTRAATAPPSPIPARIGVR